MFGVRTVLTLVLASVAAAAGAQTTYSPGALPAFSPVNGTQQTVSIGDTFSSTFESTLTAPTTSQVAAGYNYNFVDLYAFSTPTSSAAADTITLTFAGQVTNPSNVQIAIFAAGSGGTINLSQWNGTGVTTAAYTPSSTGYSYANLVGTTTGAVGGATWSSDVTSTLTIGSLTDTVVTLSNVSLGAGNYFFEVRGLATAANQGAYSGTLAILAVPEPASPLLLLMALPIVALAVRRRNRVN